MLPSISTSCHGIGRHASKIELGDPDLSLNVCTALLVLNPFTVLLFLCLQVSVEEAEYRQDLEGVLTRLLRAGMTDAFEERIAPELNAAWQVCWSI